ncbi:FecR family protein [Spirosoma telluris]|uniref:FecR family protein n=1 Tax=Spirosoma telluris TaxID=2183553 RepID=UPI002FC3551B
MQLARAFLYALEEKNTALPDDELADIADNIIQQNKQLVRPLWSSPMLRVAASILVVLGLGYLFLVYQPGSSRVDKLAEISPVLAANYNEVENTKPEPQVITLRDGSVVTLYTNSKLRYPRQFTPKQREVYLTGQAFFKITKNPKQPFWVHSDQISTQVLGTSFLVKTEGNNAKVEVRSGRVSVYTRKDIRAARRLKQNESVGVVLTANQQVDFIEKEDRLVKSVVEQPIVLQKIERHEYEFEDVPIDKVFKQLEKTYGLSVIYDPVTVKNCFITATFSDESLFEKLNLICRISRATYEIVDGQIIIHSVGCDNK